MYAKEALHWLEVVTVGWANFVANQVYCTIQTLHACM